MSLATDKVEASRARLRLAMLPPPPPVRAAGAAQDSWFTKLAQLPLMGAVIDSLKSWWDQSSIRPSAEVAAEATAAAVTPIARRYPWLFVLVAAAAGAGLAWARPWRLMFRSALFAGMLPQMASRMISRMPLKSWLTMLNSVLSKSAQGPPTADATAAEPAVP